MGIFNTIFGKSEENETSKINWINLNKLSQLDDIQEVSKSKPALIFKHSTRCSVSRMILKQFENEFDLHEKMDCYFLDLLEHREISNEIAIRFQIIHQSPQVLVIINKIAVYSATHENIDAIELKKLV